MSAQLDEISRRLRAAVDVGESVMLSNHREGIVRYKGPLDGKSGVFYGIELTKGTGKNDGVYKGNRYFTCKKSKAIFVDKKHILFKKSEYVLKKRASLSTVIPVIYHCEFMKRMYGIWHKKKGVDPIEVVLINNWDDTASKATHQKEKWALLKELMKVICGDEYGKFDLPARFLYNDSHEKVVEYLVDWLKNVKHLSTRKHILKILIPYCKTYRITSEHGNILARSMIQRQWKETKYGFRALVTRSLLAVYYASDCILADWMPWLQRCLQSKSDVRIQAWNFLSQIAILAANNKNTLKKQKALLDIETLLCDGKMIQLFKQTLESGVVKEKIVFACAEFIFGAKYILPEMQSINSVYNEVQENPKIMKDKGINEYCQLLVKGENAFDLYKKKADVIERRKIWEEGKIKCSFCPKQIENLKECERKTETVVKEYEQIKDVIQTLRMENADIEHEMDRLKSEVVTTNKRSELLTDDIKEMEMEIFHLKNDIYKLQKKTNMKVSNKDKVKQYVVDLKHWDKWNCHDVLHWILSLEDGMYIKYKSELQDILPMENIRGNELHLINEHDLISFGVNNIDDAKQLMTHVKALTNNQHEHAPMAFHDVDLSYALPPGNDHNVPNHQREGIVDNN